MRSLISVFFAGACWLTGYGCPYVFPDFCASGQWSYSNGYPASEGFNDWIRTFGKMGRIWSFLGGLGLDVQLASQLGVGRLHQDAPIPEENCRDGAHAVVGLKDNFFSFLIFLNVDPIEWDLVKLQEAFGSAAVSTPIRAVDQNGSESHACTCE
jgi:hypothetical protein